MATTTEHVVNFHEMGLDDRILKAIAKLGWTKPTLIQEKAIPLAIEGNDILARARTGSGKTGGFAIPVIQKILKEKKFATDPQVRALVMAPTKELCQQIAQHIKDLTSCCSRDVRCLDISAQVDFADQRPLLLEKPDIIVGSPSRILAHIHKGNLNLKDSLQMLVIDEADLVFSFGYENDIKEIMKHLPKIYQAFLMSATLSEDVLSIKKIVLHNPVVLKLQESQLPSSDQLEQYQIKCTEEEKFVILAAMYKLKLLRGKTIIFVKSVDRCYKLKLFLEQFGIRSCILNAELPVASRCHIVSQFNSGVYDNVIASDEKTVEDPSQTKDKQRSKRVKDKEYGVSRGIDFHCVANIINFDFPQGVNEYIHRVGRTARGDNQGTALSFVSLKEQPYLKAVEDALSELAGDGQVCFLKPYHFKMEEIEAFHYRARDALRAVTTIAVRESRLKEIRKELMNSERLKAYFEDNPKDYTVLRHDRALHTVKQQPHLRDVPDYIVPPALQNLIKAQKSKHSAKSYSDVQDSDDEEEEPTPQKREKIETQKISSLPPREHTPSSSKTKSRAKKNNPLKTLSFSGIPDKFT